LAAAEPTHSPTISTTTLHRIDFIAILSTKNLCPANLRVDITTYRINDLRANKTHVLSL
jgi:hypothetical protein